MSIFLQIKGIQGKTSDTNYKNWLDIIGYQWGVQRHITSNTSTQKDRESSNASIKDLTLTRFMDQAAPKLFIEACCGRGKAITLSANQNRLGQREQSFCGIHPGKRDPQRLSRGRHQLVCHAP